MHILGPLSIVAALATYVMAQSSPQPPEMTLLYHMEVQLGERFSLGPVPNGQERIVIPIVGGTFKGPRLSVFIDCHHCKDVQADELQGKVLNLGADWRLTDKDGKIRPDARYNIQTDDGAWIYVQTEGPTQSDGRTLLRGKFETATNGTYNWLNDVVAVGVLTRNGTEGVIIDMWEANAP
ncbi:cell outer membrane [Ascochyta rabiei]|uniref:Cell outer membrane n=1 Tax=Didymella rabiei TaxID=5454 RepID=A0A163MJF5_DIDRA|nr:cell outer membrane [Ascochyta rabiei]